MALASAAPPQQGDQKGTTGGTMGGTRCSLVLGIKEGSEGGCWLQVRTTRGGAALPEPSQSSAPCTPPVGSHAARHSGAFARSGTQSALAHRALRAVLSSEGLQEKKKITLPCRSKSSRGKHKPCNRNIFQDPLPCPSFLLLYHKPRR